MRLHQRNTMRGCLIRESGLEYIADIQLGTFVNEVHI